MSLSDASLVIEEDAGGANDIDPEIIRQNNESIWAAKGAPCARGLPRLRLVKSAQAEMGEEPCS